MGRRTDEKARHWVEKGNKKRLRSHLRKHPELRSSSAAYLIDTAIWFNRGMLLWLLENGVSPDCRCDGDLANTPLMNAAAEGDVESMKLLLAYGADYEAVNDSSETPLGYAGAWGQLEAIRLLVAAGADVNSSVDAGEGKTQLDWAGQDDVANELRRLGGKKFKEL